MNKLQAHFKKMQRMATAYLIPEPYVPMTPEATMSMRDEGDIEPRDRLFASDMIYMLDGPEQREAEAELDQQVEDLRAVIRSLMRDLRVVDHIVTLTPEDGPRRVIVASELMG